MRLDQNNVTVTTAGSRIQFTAIPANIRSIVIIALTTNTGLVYVGESAVAGSRGFPRKPGQAIAFDYSPGVGDLSEFWVDSAVDGEGISWIAVMKE